MSEHVVRFQEAMRYDIRRDADVILFMATTGAGTYFAEVPAQGPKTLRKNRQAFRETVIDLMQAAKPPCEVPL